MQDQLDLLLKEAIRHQIKQKNISDLNKKLERIVKAEHNAYNNPDNWKFTRFVQLRCRDEQGNEVILGNFREYLYRRSNTRKLCRDDSPLSYSIDQEYVSGNYWIHIDTPEPAIEDEESKIRIRNYLASTANIPLQPTLKDLGAEYLLEELKRF